LFNASVQLVTPPVPDALMTLATFGSDGSVKFWNPATVCMSWIDALESNVTKPTSSVDPSAATAPFNATKNCFSQFRIGEHPVPLPLAVLPEVSMM
jgi:hypothetical protein